MVTTFFSVSEMSSARSSVARVVGGIAHGLEQYQEGRAIRPRARYAGAMPPAARQP